MEYLKVNEIVAENFILYWARTRGEWYALHESREYAFKEARKKYNELVKVVRQLECISLPEAMARVGHVPFEVKVVDAGILNMEDAQDTLNKCLGAEYTWEKAEDAPDEPKKGLEVKVRFKLGDMEMFGAHSLTGRIMSQNPDVAYDAIAKVVIEFEETSSAWKRNNKGPHLTLMPEYVPAELIRDLLDWTRRGVEIEVVEVWADPK